MPPSHLSRSRISESKWWVVSLRVSLVLFDACIVSVTLLALVMKNLDCWAQWKFRKTSSRNIKSSCLSYKWSCNKPVWTWVLLRHWYQGWHLCDWFEWSCLCHRSSGSWSQARCHSCNQWSVVLNISLIFKYLRMDMCSSPSASTEPVMLYSRFV